MPKTKVTKKVKRGIAGETNIIGRAKQVYQRAIKDAMDVCSIEENLYKMNSDACYKAGNTFGALSDSNAAMTCAHLKRLIGQLGRVR